MKKFLITSKLHPIQIHNLKSFPTRSTDDKKTQRCRYQAKKLNYHPHQSKLVNINQSIFCTVIIKLMAINQSIFVNSVADPRSGAYLPPEFFRIPDLEIFLTTGMTLTKTLLPKP
jgi:hypothetical protein